MKRGKLIFISAFCFAFLLCFYLLISPVQASFSKGNLTEGLKDKYSASENLKGWVNISISNEPFDSEVSAFSNKTTLKALLDSNNLIEGTHYTCTSAGCGLAYASSGAGATSRSFNLGLGNSALFGVLINQSFDSIISFSINLTSNAADACSSQLKIDIGDDGTYEWYANKIKEDSFCGPNYGCYNPSAPQSVTPLLNNTPYCETINLSSAAKLMVGANVSGADNATFLLSLGEKSCLIPVSSGGIINCSINNFQFFEPRIFNVCITQISGPAYNISYESASPVCGSGNLDFPIFINPMKYDSIGNILITNASAVGTSMASALDSYLNNLSGKDCPNGCFVPIRITSNSANQEIAINNLALEYLVGSITKYSSQIYNISNTPSRISMPFRQVYLNNSGLKAPSSPGFYNLSLKLGSNEIVKKQIEVLTLPVIEDVYPLDVPASIELAFEAIVSGSNITRYRWTFGDNSTSLETTSNVVRHKYNTMGRYYLTLSVQNLQGEVNRTFTVNVVSPKDYLSTAIPFYRTNLNNIKSQLNGYPSIVKSYLERRLDIANIEARLASLQADYNAAGNNTLKHLEIAASLSAINLPKSIKVTESASGVFIMDKSRIVLTDLNTITSETFAGSEESVRNAIFGWFDKSISMSGNSKVYSAVYGNDNASGATLATYLSMNVAPNTPQDAVYVVVSEPKANVEASAGNIVTSSAAFGFPIDLSSGAKGFELVFNQKVLFFDAPIYLSPSFSKLSVISNISVCNFNKECESNLGEDSSNCRSDCKPWGKALFWIILALFLVFCLYIAAQEWYKKKYEAWLFKDKNDLFNLIHFISNAEKQGLKHEEILAKLKEKGWTHEQAVYAYKKYKGERTGMFEIPVFRIFERRKIEAQIELRNKIGISPNVAPRPIMPMKPGEKPFSILPSFGQKAPVQTQPAAQQTPQTQQKPAQAQQSLSQQAKPTQQSPQKPQSQAQTQQPQQALQQKPEKKPEKDNTQASK